MAYISAYNPTLRQVKGFELNWAEHDANWTSLTSELNNVELEFASVEASLVNLTTRVSFLEANQVVIPDGTTDNQRLVWDAGTNSWQAETVTSDIATQIEAEAGTDNIKIMTPLAVSQAIVALGGGFVDSDLVGPDGYVKFGNGLIFQWGVFDSTAGTNSVTYNTPFSSVVFFVSTQVINQATNHPNPAVDVNYNTSLTGTNFYDFNQDFVWFALGI